MTELLGLDQSTDITGYAYRDGDQIIYGAIKCPSEKLLSIAVTTPEQWMTKSIVDLIVLLSPRRVALEGLHLGKNVSTLIALAEFRGRLLYVCEQRYIPVITVTSPEVMEFLHLRIGTNRKAKKERSQYTATMLVHGAAYANEGKNPLIQVDAADAICILSIAEGKYRLGQLVNEASQAE